MTPSVVSRQFVTVAAEITERCDRCGAAGKLRAFLPTGDLTFCGHHANRYGGNIAASAERVVVESGFEWNGPRSDRA